MVAIQDALLSAAQLLHTTTPHHDATQLMLSKHINRCEAKLQQKQIVLAAITEKIQQAQQLLHVANTLGTDVNTTENAHLQGGNISTKS